MSSNEIKDAGFLYFTIPSFTVPLYAMPLVISYKYALYTTNKTHLYLNLGATRHFSGIKSDFT
jgi:hypothetical protein